MFRMGTLVGGLHLDQLQAAADSGEPGGLRDKGGHAHWLVQGSRAME